MTAADDVEADSEPVTARDEVDELIVDGELDLNTLKEMAQKVRRTLRKTKHFSRQDRPLQRSRRMAQQSLDNMESLSSFKKGLKEDRWADFAESTTALLQSLEPFLSFYQSHGKLPDIELQEALAYVLYVGVVEGQIDLGDDLEMSRDTPRGRYP